MGVAEVIPGVSGGTIAFITGIYERLLDAIKSFSPSLIGTFRKEGFKGLWAAIDGTFLLTLVAFSLDLSLLRRYILVAKSGSGASPKLPCWSSVQWWLILSRRLHP